VYIKDSPTAQRVYVSIPKPADPKIHHSDEITGWMACNLRCTWESKLNHNPVNQNPGTLLDSKKFKKNTDVD
jgi:hypothetical protein